jgi:hypothetical protein
VQSISAAVPAVRNIIGGNVAPLAFPYRTRACSTGSRCRAGKRWRAARGRDRPSARVQRDVDDSANGPTQLWTNKSGIESTDDGRQRFLRPLLPLPALRDAAIAASHDAA